ALMLPGRLEDSLRQHVPEIADGRLVMVSCRADQLRAKEEQWHARCRVTVAPADHPGGQREVVLVGLVHPPDHPGPDLLPTGDRPFGTLGYQVWLPDLRAHLSTEDADPGLPALGDLTDPHAAARL